jgi:hypothetical protein
MRRIHVAATVAGLALVLSACASSAPQTGAPSSSVAPASSVVPSAAASVVPSSHAASPTTSVPASPTSDAAGEVLDAALATQAEGTIRYTVDVRSADPDDTSPPVTGSGQVSFGDPSQFRVASPGVPGTVPPSEVIFDGDRLYSRGRDTPYLPEDTWVTLDIREGTIAPDLVMRQYGDSMLVLVTSLGVTSAERAREETIGGRSTTRYVTQVDVSAARPHLPESLLPAYDSRITNLTSAGVPLKHEVEVWVDTDGRIARTRYVQELQGQEVEALVITYDFEGYGDLMEAAPPSGAEVLTIEEAQERRQAAGTPKPS